MKNNTHSIASVDRKALLSSLAEGDRAKGKTVRRSYDGDKVKSLRKRLNLTQLQLAHGICSQSTVNLLENEKGKFNPKIVEQIAARLGVTEKELRKNS